MAVVVLCRHVNVGEDGEPNLWLRDGNAVSGHRIGLWSEELDACCADIFLGVECRVNNLNELAEDVRHRWHVRGGDGSIGDFVERVLIYVLVVFAIDRAEDAIGDVATN